MPKVLIADSVVQVDAPSGRRYTAPGRVFNMTEGDAKAAVQAGGVIGSLSGTVRRAFGFRCTKCGFGSFLRRCGRCAGACEREQ